MVTPPFHLPGSRHGVRIVVEGLTRDGEATADGEGRLHLTVPLGRGGPARTAVTVG